MPTIPIPAAIIQEFDGSGDPIAGNPDLLFASGFDYSTLSRAAPDGPPGLAEPAT